MNSPSPPQVSFVVPCYNSGQYVPDCISSILGQEGEYDFEIVAVDDCSTDNTLAALRSFSDPRLRIISHATNMGHASTINEALSLARGAFIARIDSDDRYRPNFLRIAMEIFGRYPEVGLVYGNHAIVDAYGEITAERADCTHGGRDFKGNELIPLLECNFICAATVIARREAWQGALPVPEHLSFHDWYFTLMMARQYEFYYSDQILADYRVHGGNLHTTIARNKSEEPSVFWLLHNIFREREVNANLEALKRRARNRIYARHYKVLADKYFGFWMDRDAQRCYMQALKYRPIWIFLPDLTRHLVGTMVGRRMYEATKAMYKRAARSLSSVPA